MHCAASGEVAPRFGGLTGCKAVLVHDPISQKWYVIRCFDRNNNQRDCKSASWDANTLSVIIVAHEMNCFAQGSLGGWRKRHDPAVVSIFTAVQWKFTLVKSFRMPGMHLESFENASTGNYFTSA